MKDILKPFSTHPTVEQSKDLDRMATEILREYLESDKTIADLAEEHLCSVQVVSRLLARARRNKPGDENITVEGVEELDRLQRSIQATQVRIQGVVDGALEECKRTIEDLRLQIAVLKKDGWTEW